MHNHSEPATRTRCHCKLSYKLLNVIKDADNKVIAKQYRTVSALVNIAWELVSECTVPHTAAQSRDVRVSSGKT